MVAERTRPVSDYILSALASGEWVHNETIARNARGRDDEQLTTVEVTRTIHRLRKMGYAIESGSFYKLVRDASGQQVAQLDNDDDSAHDEATYVIVEVAQRGRPAQADGRISRDKGSEQFHFRPSFWEALGHPQKVTLIADPKRRVFALQPTDAKAPGRTLHRRMDGRKQIEVTVTGLYDALSLPTGATSIIVDCRVRKGMLFCKPYIPEPCTHCAGTGRAT